MDALLCLNEGARGGLTRLDSFVAEIGAGGGLADALDSGIALAAEAEALQTLPAHGLLRHRPASKRDSTVRPSATGPCARGPAGWSHPINARVPKMLIAASEEDGPSARDIGHWDGALDGELADGLDIAVWVGVLGAQWIDADKDIDVWDLAVKKLQLGILNPDSYSTLSHCFQYSFLSIIRT